MLPDSAVRARPALAWSTCHLDVGGVSGRLLSGSLSPSVVWRDHRTPARTGLATGHAGRCRFYRRLRCELNGAAGVFEGVHGPAAPDHLRRPFTARDHAISQIPRGGQATVWPCISRHAGQPGRCSVDRSSPGMDAAGHRFAGRGVRDDFRPPEHGTALLPCPVPRVVGGQPARFDHACDGAPIDIEFLGDGFPGGPVVRVRPAGQC